MTRGGIIPIYPIESEILMEQTRRLRKKDKTHRAIMHSAKVLFEQYGIGNVTIEKISEGADVSRSTFFSHFSSLDDLLRQIANEEISDIFAAVEESDGSGIEAVIKKLSGDTYPYPYLMCELLIRSILSDGKTNISMVDSLFCKEISSDESFASVREKFSAEDLSSFILGTYFGIIFRKFITGAPFEDSDEASEKIFRFINYMKNQEE